MCLPSGVREALPASRLPRSLRGVPTGRGCHQSGPGLKLWLVTSSPEKSGAMPSSQGWGSVVASGAVSPPAAATSTIRQPKSSPSVKYSREPSYATVVPRLLTPSWVSWVTLVTCGTDAGVRHQRKIPATRATISVATTTRLHFVFGAGRSAQERGLAPNPAAHRARRPDQTRSETLLGILLQAAIYDSLQGRRDVCPGL